MGQLCLLAHSSGFLLYAYQTAPCMQLSVGFFHLHINRSIKNQQGEGREVKLLCGGCRKGKRVEMFLPMMRALLSRKKPAISSVLETPHLHLGGVGRRGGKKKQAGEALIKSRQILAAIRNSLMRISQHVFNTCCSLMLPSGDVGARRMAASRTRATDFSSLEGLSPAPAPSTPLFFGVEPSLLTHREQHLD